MDNNPGYPKYGLHIFGENAPVSSHNTMLLNELSMEEIEMCAIDIIPTSDKLPECLMTTATNRKQTQVVLQKHLKAGAKVMLTC